MRLPAIKPKRARIEIVPMIDTVFFLLVYFMIASLTMTHMNAHRVSLPVSGTATGKPNADVVVTIAKDGGCYVDQLPVSEAEIAPLLNERLRDEPKLTVVLNCDKDQSIARFVRVFDLVKQSNAASVMVATTPASSWPGQPQ